MFDYIDFAVNSKPKNIANFSATDNSRKCLTTKLQYDDSLVIMKKFILTLKSKQFKK